MQPAVFLDRDGTLIEDRGHLGSSTQVVFFPETVAALSELQQHFLLFIVTHQSGIAKGLITADEADGVNRFVVEQLADAGVTITQVYCCPHDRAQGCPCIKPNPYHLHQAARAYELDLPHSFVIGDHRHDVELGRRTGATGIYVLTGHGEKHRAELPHDALVVPNIAMASRLILQRYTAALHENAFLPPAKEAT